MSVTRRGPKRFDAEIWIGGSRVQSQRFETAAAAHQWHDETKAILEAGKRNPSVARRFGQVLEEYKNSAFLELRLSSRQARHSRFRHLADSPLASELMSELDDRSVDRWLRWAKMQPTAVDKSRQSFEQELKLLQVVLSWYRDTIDYRFIVPIVRRHFKACRYKPLPAKPHDRYLRPEEVAKWLVQLKQRPDPVYFQLAYIMVFTGLRMGEAAGLCWEAVELDGSEPRLCVIRSMSWDYRTKEPYLQSEAKTGASVRTLVIAPGIVELLRDMKAQQAGALPSDPVFRTLRGRLLRDNTIRDNFNAVFAATGIRWTGTHILRHTFATLALLTERDLGAVQAALGHADQRVTQLYAKVSAIPTKSLSKNVVALVEAAV